MLGYLIVLMLLLPFIDIYLLVVLTGEIGLPAVLLLVVSTGVIGAFILKREGVQLLKKLQTSVTAKEVSRSLLEGLVLAVGGLMLLSPGFVTDALGLAFVLRPTRERITLRVSQRLESSGDFEVTTYRL
ncbi:MAG: FxsA family protein [Candidatus Nanohaloarchaea archaeon]